MEYKVEEISPVEIRVKVNIPAEEVDASFKAAANFYRQQADLKGFRKGKAPLALIESRFKNEILREVRNDLINSNLSKVIGELPQMPLGGIDIAELVTLDPERSKPLEYSFGFEHAPEFEIPEIFGLPVEEEDVPAEIKEVEEVINRLRMNMADLRPLTETRAPIDGDIATVSFTAFENDQPVAGVEASHFEVSLGEGQLLPDFEKLVKTINAGEEGTGQVAFPENFVNRDLAGKTVEMRITVHEIKERIMPPADDELAQKIGFETIEKARETLSKSFIRQREDTNRYNAQSKLLEDLLKDLDFPLPSQALNAQITSIARGRLKRMEEAGETLESAGKTLDDLKEEATPQAEKGLKVQIFLQAVARREGIEVSPSEVELEIINISRQSQQDYDDVKRFYEQNNLIDSLRAKILADKAIDLIYSKAVVTKVPTSSGDVEEDKKFDSQDTELKVEEDKNSDSQGTGLKTEQD